ncbi:MAG: MGDG synthase family glycosyltransferase [Acidimicrobiia bacterium]
MQRRILIVSASMGAGHDGAARELARRLEAEGHEARIVDFLDCCPFGIGWFIKWSYLLQLRFAPWSYDLTYRLWYKLPSSWGFIVRLDTFVAGRRLRKAIRQSDADVVVSTYPLSSLVLGNMRKKGWLKVPAVTFLTDFAVHPLWVHPHIDAHVATSPFAAETASERGGKDARASGPLVSDRFSDESGSSRLATRAAFDIAPDERAVLVVAGSWGVGDVIGTVEAIARAGDYHPVTVCGRDQHLKSTLEERGLGTVIGWTDEMPALMAACDAMVENAGGLTANEAFAVGLPVITFKPIAGHGKDNAEGMAEIGVSRYARTEDELRSALDEVTEPGRLRDEQLARAAALFAGDAKTDVLEMAEHRDRQKVVAPVRDPKAQRRVTTVAASLVLIYAGLTIGAQAVAAFGVGVAKAPKSAQSQVFVGVRLTRDQLGSRTIQRQLDVMGVTAIVDGRVARTGTVALEHLSDQHVDIGNGGWGKGRPFRYLRAKNDVAKTGDLIRAATGHKVREFVPERRLDAFDQIWCRRRGQKLVEPDSVFKPEMVPASVKPRRVYVLDGRDRDAEALRVALVDFSVVVDRAGLSVSSLAQLR